MENDIQELTESILAQCAGKNAGVVIGAGLNMVMAALQQMPNAVTASVAASFRSMADQLDTMHSGDRR